MGERITPESPILATLPSRWKTKRDHVSDENLQSLIYTMIQGKVSRIKKENRYDKALITMFRKRFNTKLKLNNKVNSNVAELVMAHKLPGVQDTYTAPTLEQIYDTIKHAIPELTIDPSARKQALLDQKEQENSELQMKVDDIERLKADMDRMQLILDSKT